jgi:hypothetical protein
MPAVAPELLPPENAQVAHNCIVTDGTLRPQAQYVRLKELDWDDHSEGLFYDRRTDTINPCWSRMPVTLYGEPMQDKVAVGAGPNSKINYYTGNNGFLPYKSTMDQAGLSGTVSYQTQYLSTKPVNRVYAMTRVRKIKGYVAEGPLIGFDFLDPTAILYEGDLATLNITATAGDDNATHVRIYRSMSGLDTGHVVQNDQDTNWHLVAELPLQEGSFLYTDGGSVTELPLDVNYSSDMHDTLLAPYFFGLSESGWFVAASPDGDIQISERYMHHAWPVANHYHVPHNINSMAVSGDNVYLGTTEFPYVGALSFGDSPLQASFRPFEEYLPCVGDTMAATPTGAIYVSPRGFVSVSREGATVLTQNIAGGGSTIFNKQGTIDNGKSTITWDIVSDFSTFGHALYYQGVYYAFGGKVNYQETL